MDEEKPVNDAVARARKAELQRNNTVPLLMGDDKDDKIQILMEGYPIHIDIT